MIEYYFGLDFDNCGANKAFYADAPTAEQRLVNKSIITTNPLLVNHIAVASQQAKNKTGLIGSARQDASTDHLNGIMSRGKTTSGSCCPFIKQFCEEMGMDFDPFMLGDIEESEIGDTFKTIMAAIEDGTWSEYPDWKTKPSIITVDEFKRTMHFAHFQYIANKNPGEKKEAVYEFFDDNYAVLKESIRFFRKNSHLIPEGMTYNIYYYDGSETPCLLATIIGIGAPYSNYKEIVQEMMATSNGVYDNNDKLECIDTYATENLTPVEDLTAQQKTIKKINKSKCYLNLTIDGAEDFLKKGNGNNNFVLRPSSLKVEGLFTFTFSALVDTEVVHHRFAIDQKGKIYSMSANGELLKKMDISKGIKAAFEQIQNHLVSTKVATPVAKDEKVARPSPRANQAHLLQPAATNTSPFSLPLNGTLFNAQPGIKPLEVRTPVRPLEPKAPAAVAPIIQAPKPAVHSEIKPLEVRTPVRPLEPKAPAAVGPIILPPKPAAHSGIKPLEVRTPEKPLEPKAQVHAAPLIQPQKPAAHLPRRSAGRGTSAGAFKFHTKNPTQRPELGKPSAHPSSFFNNGQAKIQPAQGRAEKQSTPSGQAPKQHTLNNM